MNKLFSFKKGQLFAIDTMLSLVGFILFFVVLLSLWNILVGRFHENSITEELQIEAFQISDLLLTTSGLPVNWEKNPLNVTSIGLMYNDGELDIEKINAFFSLNYSTTKKRFNIERLEYLAQLKDRQGNAINSTGIAPTNKTTTYVISIARFMRLGNQTVQFQFTLWRT